MCKHAFSLSSTHTAHSALIGWTALCECVCLHSTLSPVPQLAVICMSVQAMAHRSRTTTAPLRRVNRVQFGVLGPEEIKGELVLAQTVLDWVVVLIQSKFYLVLVVGSWDHFATTLLFHD